MKILHLELRYPQYEELFPFRPLCNFYYESTLHDLEIIESYQSKQLVYLSEHVRYISTTD